MAGRPRTGTTGVAIHVNLAKLLAIAAMAPPSSVGIAQRAALISEHTGGIGTAEIVALTTALGPISAIVGALGFGRLADLGSASTRFRWGITAAAAAIAVLGLALMPVAAAPWQLAVGWSLAKAGCFGAISVLRTLLATAFTGDRRRAATVMVGLAYLGTLIPLVVLLLLPGTVWTTTLVFSLLSLAVPLLVLLRGRGDRLRGTGPAQPAASTEDAAATRQLPLAATSPVLSWPLILTMQFVSSFAVAAYLAYHALDVVARTRSGWSDGSVQLSVLTLAAAILGILVATGVLLARPALIDRPAGALILSGLALGLSMALRPLADSVPALLGLLFLSGAAEGVIAAALFTAAMAAAPLRREGRMLGIYSAVEPLGQVVGPLIGVAVFRAMGPELGYGPVFLVSGLVTVAATLGVWLLARRPRPASRGATPAPVDARRGADRP